MNPEHLSDDEFCRYADDIDPWLKSAISRIESKNNIDTSIDDIYSLIEDANYKIRQALKKLEDI